MFESAARSALLACSTLLVLSCGGNGLGCSGAAPLPQEPAPWGFPLDQAIEGGMQARITRPGFEKLTAMVPALARSVLPTPGSPLCLGVQASSLKVLGLGADGEACNAACGPGVGCPVWADLRPDLVPPGGIAVTLPDGNEPVIDVDAGFDVHMTMPLRYRLCAPFVGCGGWSNVCALRFDAPGTHIKAAIPLAIDPATGKLTIALRSLDVLGLDLRANDCGVLGDVLNFAIDIANAVAKGFIADTLVGLLRPQLTQLIAGFLPDPPGLANRFDLHALLAAFAPPPEAALEMLAIAGGYVSARGGGLNVGVIGGANSDRNPATRAPIPGAVNSEPSPCVPARPTYDLSAAPWKLPLQPLRKDHLLDPAAAFTGMPDPMDAMGNLQDVALGVSRTLLDQVGFHLYSSGGLCLQVGSNLLAGTPLNTSTLKVLLPSLQNLVEDSSAPLFIALRPEQPLRFAIGAGAAGDPLVQVHAADLRLDLYAFLEERYVRLLTLGVDLTVGVDLAVTRDAQGNPALAPRLSRIAKGAVQAQVTNTDLLGEEPAQLARLFDSLVDLAVSQLGGAVGSFALPSVAGFTLKDVQLGRVQTPQDDFLAIVGNLDPGPDGATLLPLPPGGGPPAAVPFTASIADLSVPPPDVIRAALLAGRHDDGDTPSVTLALGGAGDLEWSYRMDGGWWHPWSREARPTLHDPAFVVQARHAIDVRARRRGEPGGESGPQRLEVVIDSLPPELALAVDGQSQTIAFHATDNVSAKEALRFAWRTPSGGTSPGPRDQLSFAEAWEASGRGRQPLLVAAWDERGNRVERALDLGSLAGFQGRATDGAGAALSGCGCHVGNGRAQGSTPLVAGMLGVLVALAAVRRRHGRARAGAPRG